MERAYAKIEKGTIQLVNHWLERQWNAFMGSTTELLILPNRRDLLARKSPEFHVDYDGRPLAAQDLGDIGWSDTSDSHGASVVLSLSGPGVALQLETVLLHRFPGMIRTLSITNTSGTPTTVTRAAVDVLPLRPADYPTATAKEGRLSVMIQGETATYAALKGIQGTVLLGAYRKARFVVFDPNPAYCAAVWEGSALVPPGKTWRAPATTLYLPRGAGDTALQAELTAFHQAWEARKAAQGGLHPSRN